MMKRRWIIVLGCWLCGAGGLPSTVAGDRATLRDCYRACGKECGTTLMPKGLDDEACKQIRLRS